MKQMMTVLPLGGFMMHLREFARHVELGIGLMYQRLDVAVAVQLAVALEAPVHGLKLRGRYHAAVRFRFVEAAHDACLELLPLAVLQRAEVGLQRVDAICDMLAVIAHHAEDAGRKHGLDDARCVYVHVMRPRPGWCRIRPG